MTLAQQGARMMISEFGEEVTIYPQESDQPEDPDDPIFFEPSDSEPDPFDIRVRVYSSPSNETLQEYGFEEDTDSIIYSDKDEIEQGDAVDIYGDEFVVSDFFTNQIGDGPYIWIYSLRGK